MATQGNENALKYVILFPHDVTAAILVSQSNETAAMLVFQTSPVEVELFSYVKPFFCRFCWLREWKRSILVSVLSRPNPLAMLNLRITVSHLFAQKEALAFIPVFEKSFKFLESGRKRCSIELFFQLFLHLRKTISRSSIKLNSGKREKGIYNMQAKTSRIPCLNFGEFRFQGSFRILFPVKIFCVFPNPAKYVGQIPDPEKTLKTLFNSHLSKLSIV